MLVEDLEARLYCYRATCWKVIDGDTLELDIDLGLHVFSRQRVRLLGLNTPEIHGVKKGSEEYLKGLDAAEAVARLLRPHGLGRTLEGHVREEDYAGSPTDLWVETSKDKIGKYGRFLVKVWVQQSSKMLELNRHLIDKGFAERAWY